MAAKNIKQKPRTPEQVRRQARGAIAIAAVIAIGCLAAIAVCSVFAVRDHHNAQAYAAAPNCPAGTRGTGDCIAVLPETVISVDTGGKGGDLVDLTGSLSVKFKSNASSWAAGLGRGDSVRVQVWEDQAQALVSPSGALVYDSDAAPKATQVMIGTACFALAFLFIAAAVAASCAANAAIGRISLFFGARPYRWQLVLGECMVLSVATSGMAAMFSAGSWDLGLIVAAVVLVAGGASVKIAVSRRRARLSRGDVVPRDRR
jgi:hypothetical protein